MESHYEKRGEMETQGEYQSPSVRKFLRMFKYFEIKSILSLYKPSI